MHTMFSALVWIHAALGTIALASFWVPAFAPKGSATHVRFGRVFAYSMMATATLAAAASTLTLLAPLATHPGKTPDDVLGLRLGAGLMLAYLAAVTFVAAFSGLRAVRRVRGERPAGRPVAELAANAAALVLAVVVLAAGLYYDVVLLMAISAIGLLTVPGNLRFLLRPPAAAADWMIQHMRSMIGAGIAAHTAFLVVGVGRVAPALTGEPLLWLAPTLIGAPASVLLRRHYRRRLTAPAAS